MNEQMSGMPNEKRKNILSTWTASVKANASSNHQIKKP